MRRLGFVWVIGLALGCGGQSTRSTAEDTHQGAAPHGDTSPLGGGGAAGSVAHPTGAAGTAGAGGRAPEPVSLGDAENVGEGVPVAPTEAAFFWISSDGGVRIGNWFAASAGLSWDVGLSKIEPPRDGSTDARNVSGTGAAEGVVLWVQLDHPSNRPVNLSAYWGITFWAKLESASGVLVVALNDGSTTSSTSLDWSALPAQKLSVGPEWRQFTLSFDDFMVVQPSLVSIDFFAGEGGTSFDLWIDDLTLCASRCR